MHIHVIYKFMDIKPYTYIHIYTHKRYTPVEPHSYMCKSGTTSTNLHTVAM